MNTRRTRAARIGQRTLQTLSLAAFLGLLFIAGRETAAWLAPDALLRLDPLSALAAPLAAREFIPGLWPGLAVLLLTLLLGRVFCGYFCPLGFTLDLARGGLRLLGRPFRAKLQPGEIAAVPGAPTEAANDEDRIVTRGWYGFKYLLLLAALTAAALGFNAAFWGAPLPLAARFYLLAVEPLLLWLGNLGLDAARQLSASPAVQYAVLDGRFYSGLTFILIFFSGLFLLELARPRFWCRYLCPAGAALGILARFAPWRRRVGKCVGCGRCSQICPTSAIAPDGISTARAECLACRACQDACPLGGVYFSCSGKGEVQAPEYLVPAPTFRRPARAEAKEDILEQEPDRPFACSLPSRRAFLGATAAGCLLGFIHFVSVKRLLSKNTGPSARPMSLLRPPGALPEPQFLARCTRCGLCLKACPSNGLQPAWGEAWVEDIFTPELIPERGPCEPDCNACGRVCPSGAVASLSLAQKQWAKIGTAEIIESRCLAFAEGRVCVVCQEVCPYGAIELRPMPNIPVPAPVVMAEYCFGCGYCEYHCPAARKAILAKPAGAVRLDGGDYPAAARALGLELLPRQGAADEPARSEAGPSGPLPPGFVE